MAKVSKTTPAAAPSSRMKKTASAAVPSSRSARKAAAQPAAPSRPAKQTIPAAAPSHPEKQTIPSAAPSHPEKQTIPSAAPSHPGKQTVPEAAEVIEIPASPTPSVTSRTNTKKAGERKRASPPVPLELDEIEMWTPRQKRRIDEDCCILSTDPLAAAEVPAVVASAAANDDIAVVAERGKVACRDYPHPRYACAKYPFATTPHERYCKQCFCYVCDIAAPCKTWIRHAKYGHCHASDKDKSWQTMRGEAMRKQCKT